MTEEHQNQDEERDETERDLDVPEEQAGDVGGGLGSKAGAEDLPIK
jgi:hypothetical protein